MEKIEKIAMSITCVILIVIIIFSVQGLHALVPPQEKKVLGSRVEKKIVAKKKTEPNEKKNGDTNILVRQALADEPSIISLTPTPKKEQSASSEQKEGNNTNNQSYDTPSSPVDPTPTIVSSSPAIETPVREATEPQPSPTPSQDQRSDKTKNDNAGEHATVPGVLNKIIEEKNLPIKL